MYAQENKSSENKSRAVANSVARKKSNGKQGFGFVDNRPDAIDQRKLVHSKNDYYTLQQELIQKKENNAGLPDNLEIGIKSPNASQLIQRAVNLNGETDPNVIWTQVGGLVSTRYKRKQLLFNWAKDGESRAYTDPQELADDLDLQNRKGGRLGRARPDWAPNLTLIFSQTFGGSWHRRHIIMSSLMRYAVYAVTDINSGQEDKVIKAYNQLTEGLAPVAKSMAQAEANLVYILHNNPANLVIDQGSWNSAIGAYAHNVEELLKKPHDKIYDLYRTDANTFLNQFVKGFQPGLQMTINAFWRKYFEENPFKSVEELIDTLEMMYDNAAVDLMSTQAMPQQEGLTADLLNLHGGFASVKSSGDLETLKSICYRYISLGKNPGANVGGSVVRYNNVL